jgi:hypothetical protein
MEAGKMKTDSILKGIFRLNKPLLQVDKLWLVFLDKQL